MSSFAYSLLSLAVFGEQPLQRSSIHAQHRRRGGLVATGVREHALDVAALELGHRGPIAVDRRSLCQPFRAADQRRLISLQEHGTARRDIATPCASAFSMTALLASLGLLPAAMSHAIGSDTQRLISSTLLTMLLLPTLYELMDRWFGSGRIARRKLSP